MKTGMYAKSVNLLFAALFLVSFPVNGQISERVYATDYRIDAEKVKELSVEVDNINFFKNNEFAGDVMKGYSLPGFWIQPKAVYYPMENIKLELGLHALIYHGANKYPNYAYQDIAKWKGNQYQRGCHLLPWFRAQVGFSDNFNLILGNIYGGATHQLIEPLYSPELNITADPEVGVQAIWNTKVFDFDAWLNWESFIFHDDTHQEAFTVGVSSRFKLNNPESAWHFYVPVQGLAQHRGGEIDTLTENSVQTLMNGSVGVGTVWNVNYGRLKKVEFELDYMGYYQQAGEIWPFDSGSGFYARASADINDFRVKTSYFKSNDFISMFGLPFYGSVSTKEKGAVFKNPQTVYFGAEYSRKFGKGFALGVDLDVFYCLKDKINMPETGWEKSGSGTSFTMGVYLRINPSFLLKKY